MSTFTAAPAHLAKPCVGAVHVTKAGTQRVPHLPIDRGGRMYTFKADPALLARPCAGALHATKTRCAFPHPQRTKT